MSDFLQPHRLQCPSLPCPSLPPRICSDSCPLNQGCHPTVSSPVAPFPPALSLSQHHGLFQWVSTSHQVASVLELQLQHQPFPWIFRVWKMPSVGSVPVAIVTYLGMSRGQAEWQVTGHTHNHLFIMLYSVQ